VSKHLSRWGALYVLALLFLGSWVGQFIMMLIEVGNDAREHGSSFRMSDFLPQFWSSTFENWQSEWLQLLVQGAMLLGMKHLIFKADSEDTEIIDRKIDALLRERGLDPQEIEDQVRADE
jgi:hypothetical protein